MQSVIKYYIFSAFTFILMACANQIEQSTAKIEKIRSKYIPDNRVAVFNVQVSKGEKGVVILSGETTHADAKTALLSSLQNSNISFVDSLNILPDSSMEKPWALVTVSVANLRDQSRYAAQLVSQLIMGTPVKILKKQQGWTLIQCPDKYIAWINASSLHFINSQELTNWKNRQRAVLNTDAWMLDAKGKKVSDLVLGSIVQVLTDSAEFSKVALPDGRWGYIEKTTYEDFDTWANQNILQKDKLVNTAFEFMGLPYLWGGTSSKGLDCSGFVKNIYFLNGYILARDASQQFNHGLEVETKLGELQKGDLLFFGNTKTKKVTHVGMYIGDTEFIHASARVMVNSLDSTRSNYSDYRAGSWLGARRYAGQAQQEGLVPVAKHPWYVSTGDVKLN